jgi:hypothetical protein
MCKPGFFLQTGHFASAFAPEQPRVKDKILRLACCASLDSRRRHKPAVLQEAPGSGKSSM